MGEEYQESDGETEASKHWATKVCPSTRGEDKYGKEHVGVMWSIGATHLLRQVP